MIEHVTPQVSCGEYVAKRAVGESVRVEADVFTDGHDHLGVALRHCCGEDGQWQEVDMEQGVNDRWAGEFVVHSIGLHQFTICAWVDHFATWRHDFQKRVEAGQNVAVDLLIGAQLVDAAARSHEGEVARALSGLAALLRSEGQSEAIEVALGSPLRSLMWRYGQRLHATELDRPLRIWVDRVKARFSSWYELFPRSAAPNHERHGALKDIEARLEDIAEMGFDVLYLPPIHPIGRQFRKGRNNSTVATPDDVGSPWAIGGPEGGHDAIHPQLGTFADFDDLVKAAAGRNIEIAMDLAFQCSPDHPYVKQHPEWFKKRPDGSTQYAENPPKKYQDIYPFDFECEAWDSLWRELLRVTLFWHQRGVKIFRVDNPHTKPFPFWQWLIEQVKKRDPDVLFLAEAFTRPKVMYRLAKIGFTQSYTYFAWRNDPWSIRQYYTELNTPPVCDFFRANAWPNTPDILPEPLQFGGRGAYVSRAVLAATLCANYGVYGPAFELMEHRALKANSEEYYDSEKYQIRHWDLNQPNTLAEFLARLNQIRKDNPALQHDRNITFHDTDNGAIVCYSKRREDNVILVAVNCDPYHTQWANLHLHLEALGLTHDRPFQAHDLLTGARYRWQGSHAVVGLDPGSQPAHLFAIRKHARTEFDFEYFL